MLLDVKGNRIMKKKSKLQKTQDQEAIEQLKQIISVNYLHELTAEEISSVR